MEVNMNQADMFKDELLPEERQQLTQLCRENSPNIEVIFKDKIYTLENLQKLLAESETTVKELKQKIAKIEEDEIPNLMDELQVSILSFQGGISVALDDKVYTRVNNPERERGWEWLRERGYTGVIKPVIVVTVAQDESKSDIVNLMNMIKNSIEYENVELSFDYHAGQLSAVARHITESFGELDPGIFKQSVKRGVKIKQLKSAKNKRNDDNV
jgi:hypothetical protein